MLIGERQTFSSDKKMPLPYDAEVEYLQSNGGQWIDTEVFPNGQTSWELRLQRLGTAVTDQIAIGSRQYASQPNYDFSVWTNPSSGKGLACHYAYNASVMEDSGWVFKGNIKNSENKIRVTPDGVWVNGTKCHSWNYAGNRPAFQSAYSLFLFGLNIGNTSVDNRKFTGRIFGCKIWIEDVLVRDFIPVRVGSGSNAVGYMYDRANPTGGVNGNGLYSNSGTGTFSVGADVN